MRSNLKARDISKMTMTIWPEGAPENTLTPTGIFGLKVLQMWCRVFESHWLTTSERDTLLRVIDERGWVLMQLRLERKQLDHESSVNRCKREIELVSPSPK